MSDVIDRIKAQIALMNTAVKKPFDADPAISDELVTRLATYIAAAGTTSILDISHYISDDANLDFFYDRKTGYVFPHPFGNNTAASQKQSTLGPDTFTMLSRDNRFNYWIFCKFTADGYPVFFSFFEDTGSDWQAAFKGLVFVASVLVTSAFPALGAQIGSAVVGPTVAAQYPAITAAIGNAAVSSVLNGGDIQSAVASSFGGVVGGSVGGVVASATDSVMIGAAAAAATRAAITGGDLTQAVAGSLLRSGAGAINAGALITPVQGNSMPLGDFTLTDSYDDFGGGFGAPITPADANFDGSLTWADVAADTQVSFGPSGYDFSSPVSYSPNWAATAPANGGIVSSTGGINLTDLAMTGLKLVSAWNQAGNPAPRVGSSATKVNANGTLTQVVNGRATTLPMPAGTPYLTANGSLVTNNGDGTFTTVSSTGQVSTSHYSATGAGLTGLLQNPTVLIGVAALAVLLLMPKRGSAA